MPAAANFAGTFAGPARVAVQPSASPAARVLAVVAAATSPATTSVTAPRIVPNVAPAPLSPTGAAAAARVIGLAAQAVQSSASPLRPTVPAGARPASRLRSPVYTSAAPPTPSSSDPLGPVFASPAAASFAPSFYASGYSGGGGGGTYSDDAADVEDTPFSFEPTPMQTRNLVGVEAPSSVWLLLGGGGLALIAYHLWRRDFAGAR